MTPGLLDAILGALIEARASAKAISAVERAWEAWASAKRPVGQPRKYALVGLFSSDEMGLFASVEGKMGYCAPTGVAGADGRLVYSTRSPRL
jgi:hypothetical protein